MEASGAHGGLAALLERGISRAEFEAFYLALPLERDRTRIAGLLYDSALLSRSARRMSVDIVASLQARCFTGGGWVYELIEPFACRLRALQLACWSAAPRDA